MSYLDNLFTNGQTDGRTDGQTLLVPKVAIATEKSRHGFAVFRPKFYIVNNRVKKMFFDDYIKQGGMKEYKEWVKSRWFSKRPVISAQIGKSRN